MQLALSSTARNHGAAAVADWMLQLLPLVEVSPALPQLASLQASKLQQSRDTSASQLRGLVERHRFLRAVCTFHAASEDEVLFPAVK